MLNVIIAIPNGLGRSFSLLTVSISDEKALHVQQLITMLHCSVGPVKGETSTRSVEISLPVETAAKVPGGETLFKQKRSTPERYSAMLLRVCLTLSGFALSRRLLTRLRRVHRNHPPSSERRGREQAIVMESRNALKNTLSILTS